MIPFGCNYEVPNLQPGTYYVIVEAFQAGSEGVVNITLSSIQDRAFEIVGREGLGMPVDFAAADVFGKVRV